MSPLSFVLFYMFCLETQDAPAISTPVRFHQMLCIFTGTQPSIHENLEGWVQIHLHKKSDRQNSFKRIKSLTKRLTSFLRFKNLSFTYKTTLVEDEICEVNMSWNNGQPLWTRSCLLFTCVFRMVFPDTVHVVHLILTRFL